MRELARATCQFAEDLPCPLALSLERFVGLYFEALKIATFHEIWDTGSDSIRQALKRGLTAGRDSGLNAELVERLQVHTRVCVCVCVCVCSKLGTYY